ncbi:MAG: hypothetical protein HKN36_06610 [Hellea sp.]|nr:hypothetical protein [Hellea sp.]
MKFSKLSLVLPLVLVTAACSSTPERRGPPPDQQARGAAQSSGVFVKPVGLIFVAMDTNRDTVFSEDELTIGIPSEWSAFGSNPSAAYFSDWSRKSLGSTDAFPTFLSFDANINGVVTSEEFSDRLRQEFASMDKNQDGRVERSEMLIAFEAPRGRDRKSGQSERGQRGGEGGSRRNGPPPR